MRLMQNLILKIVIIEKLQQYDIWLADLNPARGSIPGKIRPVVIIQSNILNKYSISTVVLLNNKHRKLSIGCQINLKHILQMWELRFT